jgi:hypothetical protein
MGDIEWRAVTPEELVREIEQFVKRSRENKYAFQVGLKDVDFDIDEDRLEVLGLSLPFRSIDQAEEALAQLAIKPAKFIEYDSTLHQIRAFDHKPVGYSGFMNCVTHSLALTDQGLFEVGRYPAISLSQPGRYWQWFLHRCLATPEQAAAWQADLNLSPDQLLERAFQALTSA